MEERVDQPYSDPRSGDQEQNSHFVTNTIQERPPYDPTGQTGWMSQIQPIPLDNFHNPTGPLVYEGYVPESSIRSVYPPLHYRDENNFAFYQNNDHPPFNLTAHTDAAIDESPGASEKHAPITQATRPRRATRPPKQHATRPPNPPKPERKRGRRKGEKRGPREVLDPGEEFHILHGQATEAFLDKGDHETALRCILQAISINPEIHSAHVLLSEIYFARGENDKAFAALFSGAHSAPNDPNVWHQLADACLQRSTENRETTLQQASYCFSRILSIDQKDWDARFQKAAISKELGYYAKALKDLDTLLKDMPHNSSVLRQIAEVCTDLGDITKAKALYEEALEAQRLSTSAELDAFDWNDLIVYVDLVSYAQNTTDAIKVLKQISREFVGRSDETFWDEFASDDREWDAQHKSRRIHTPGFQPNRYSLELYGAALPLDMRVKLGDLRLTEGSKEEAIKHFEWLSPEIMEEGSNVYQYQDLFLQAADSLRTYKEFRQAFRYYKALNSINAYDDAEFWLGIGSCAYVCGCKEDAIKYYENAKLADPQNVEARTQLSKLYVDTGDRAKAIKNARETLTFYENAVGTGSKRKYERKETREAREEAQAIYRRAYMLTPPPGERRVQNPAPSFSRRAREKRIREKKQQINRGEVQAEHEPEQSQDQSRSQERAITPQDRQDRLHRLPKRRLTKAQRTKEQQEVSIKHTYATLCSQTQAMRGGDEEARGIWLECAESLIDEFRSKKVFYPAERYKKFQGYDLAPSASKDNAYEVGEDDDANRNDEDVLMPSIENTIPDDYCEISFSLWLEVFLEYALSLANLQYEPSECYTVIRAAQDCTIWYHDADAMTQIYTCYAVCALALHDEATLFGTALRWFMREYTFCSDAYRLFSALNFYYPHVPDKGGKSGQIANAKFRIAPNQKFVFRSVVSLDSQLPEDYGEGTVYGPVPAFMRKERHDTNASYLRVQDAIDPMLHDTQSPGRAHSQVESSFYSAPTPASEALQQESEISARARPMEMQIHLIILYGQILYASGSFTNALSYFYRAMSLSPDNPILLLTMALCYLHQMLKRQCENRHTYFLQGLALFERYAELRLSWAKNKIKQSDDQDLDVTDLVDTIRREIEFNRARCWQMVGMADLAIRGYESMIESRSVKQEDADDMDIDMDMDMVMDKSTSNEQYSMEAAYSVALLYATNGDMRTAKEITEKWLVVE